MQPLRHHGAAYQTGMFYKMRLDSAERDSALSGMCIRRIQGLF